MLTTPVVLIALFALIAIAEITVAKVVDWDCEWEPTEDHTTERIN